MFTTLRDAVRDRLVPGRRLLVGIAGAPGAGKSTLAARLTEVFDQAIVVPMDGFHLSNAELHRLGLTNVKGAPQTFDSAGYVALLRRLRDRPQEIVYAPAFDHILNEPVAGSIPVFPDTDLVITEGNYLLLWDGARAQIDLTVHLDAPPEDRIAGLIERQRAKGLDPDAALDWVLRSDEANARLIQEVAHHADLRLSR